MTAPIVLDLDAIEAAAKAAFSHEEAEFGLFLSPLLVDFAKMTGLRSVDEIDSEANFGAIQALIESNRRGSRVILELVRRLRAAEAVVAATAINLAPGDILIMRLDQALSEDEIDRLGKLLLTMSPIPPCLVMPKDQQISTLNPDDMRQAGWVRAERGGE